MSQEHDTLSVTEAAGVLGIHPDSAYEAIRQGTFPVEVVRIGRTIRIPTRPLYDLVGRPISSEEARS